MEDRLFVGVCPAGIVYADRGLEERGDYKQVAFLPYDTLELEVRDARSPLLAEVRASAEKMQARAGQLFAISAAGEVDAKRGLATGQTIRLGSARRGAAQ